MNGMLFHRGPIAGHAVSTATLPPTVTFTHRMPHGEAEVTYRRTRYLKDNSAIYMPAVMVAEDGSVTP